jgi:hypothetical protein
MTPWCRNRRHSSRKYIVIEKTKEYIKKQITQQKEIIKHTIRLKDLERSQNLEISQKLLLQNFEDYGEDLFSNTILLRQDESNFAKVGIVALLARKKPDSDMSFGLMMSRLYDSIPNIFYSNYNGLTDILCRLLKKDNKTPIEKKLLEEEYYNKTITGICVLTYGKYNPSNDPFEIVKESLGRYWCKRGIGAEITENVLGRIFHLLSINGFLSKEELMDLAVRKFKILWEKVCSKRLSGSKLFITYRKTNSLVFYLSIMSNEIRISCIDRMLSSFTESIKSLVSEPSVLQKSYVDLLSMDISKIFSEEGKRRCIIIIQKFLFFLHSSKDDVIKQYLHYCQENESIMKLFSYFQFDWKNKLNFLSVFEIQKENSYFENKKKFFKEINSIMQTLSNSNICFKKRVIENKKVKLRKIISFLPLSCIDGVLIELFELYGEKMSCLYFRNITSLKKFGILFNFDYLANINKDFTKDKEHKKIRKESKVLEEEIVIKFISKLRNCL